MKEVKFIIRDTSGDRQKLVPPEMADHRADELRDEGYLIVANRRNIPYGATLRGIYSVEAVPIAASG